MPKKRNGFANFMFELKKNDNLSIGDAQKLAGELWSNMSVAEREKYSKNQKYDTLETPLPPEDVPKKYNCLGVSIDEEMRKIAEKRKKENANTMAIKEILETASEINNGIYDQVFFFFSASYFVVINAEKTYPAELALAKFSLRRGIIDKMHMLINPGRLPLGYPGEAMLHAKRTHRLDLPPDIPGEKEYDIMLDRIMTFVDAKQFNSHEIPPFFAYSDGEVDDIKACEMILEKIAYENDRHNAFRVLKADELLFHLHKYVIADQNQVFKTEIRPFPSQVMAWEMLRRDEFRYYDIGCEKHISMDHCAECCLSKVLRLGYLFVQYNLDKRFKKVPGCHVPINYSSANENDADDEEDDEEDFWWSDSKNSLTSASEKFSQLSLYTSSSKLLQTDSSLSGLQPLNKTPSNSSIFSNTNGLLKNNLYRRRFGKLNSKLIAEESDNNSDKESEITSEATSFNEKKTSWVDDLVTVHSVSGD